MIPSWIAELPKSVSARIEGRNTAIALIVGFCAFAFYILITTYGQHPQLSIVLSCIILAFVGSVVLTLFLKPQPSEVKEKQLFLQRDLFSARGMQSHEEVIAILREARSMRDLPAPSAIVKGSATNPQDYESLAPEEAEKLVRQDRDAINKLLLEEAARLPEINIEDHIGGGIGKGNAGGISTSTAQIEQRSASSNSDAS
jgi:hypothetical protein